MAVLKIVPKLYQEKISEKLKEEISLVTTGEAKYYNRLYKFFQYTDIQCTADINYETRKMYMDSLEKEDISEKYKAELLSLFDRLKIENMPDVYSQGKPFSVEQEFFKQDKLFLLYVPNKKKAQSFRQVVDKNDLLWDLTRIHSSQLVRQTKILLCEILNMDKVQRHRRYFLEPLKALIRFCDKYGIDDIEEMEQADENRFYLYLNKESEIIKKQASKIVEFARRTLFLTDSETNWRACIWYMDRFQFDKSRINASSPVKSLSFINIYEKENRWYLQLYAKYLVGISDLSLSNIRNTISFISQFLKYLDGQSKKVTELEMQDIADYVSVLDESDIKYSTFNRYITHMHTFLQFLKMKNIEVLKFYPERFLKKGFSEHNERSVPEKTIAHLIKELPAFPEHLQLMYLILFCTGIRKSEVCTIKSGAFYSQGNENWMRIYQSKMRREKVIPVPSLLVGLVNDYEKKYGIKNGEYLFKNKKGGAFNGQTFSNQMIRECSITDKKWEELERSYKAFLYKKGLALYVRRNRPDRRNVEQQSSAQISFLKMYYEYVVKCKTADIPENEKDVWDMRKLDIVPRSNPIRGRYRLDFREIRQKEFKEIIKKILYSHCQTKAMGSIKGELRGFRRFASFMYDRFPEVKHFTEISRDMIEDYLVYIKTDTGLTSVSYTTELSVLDNLLDEIGRELEIENICNLFLSSDCRAYDNALPEAYSDAEIRRFNCALTKLKPQLGRCLIIHQMLGTRIEDTLTLRRDCLSEKSGHYFITIIQQKTRKYKRPVSNQLAELIRKAIEVSEKEHPDSEYIFLQDNGKLYTDSMLKYHVNIMIYENDIRDDNGNYFEFRTHRFRHTFGVKLTEMKLDDDSIARLLGHKDTRTIPHYRRLRNEALAEDTKAVRDEMNELLAQYRREKENAETR